MSLTARAYAKINLFLDVISKREDGYHNIDTVMHNVSLYDEITLQLTEKGINITCNVDDLDGENNIVFNACNEFLSYIDEDVGVDIFIKKNIPLAAGLGGGSSDAATVLNLLNHSFDNRFDDATLLHIAAKLGADVPFFIKGGTARATGIGDNLSNHLSPKMHFVLLKEGTKMSTAAMYNQIDSMDYKSDNSASKMIKALTTDSVMEISKHIYNCFEVCWDFDKISEPFIGFDTLKVFLSGSGPTVCALFNTLEKAKECAFNLTEKGYRAYCVESVNFGMELV